MIFVGVDIGGTFTDLVLFEDSHPQDIQVVKVSTSPKKPEQAVVEALSNHLGKLNQVSLLAHATTLATNSLLTHSGLAKTALITNDGFRDILEIGRQRRPNLYDLHSRRPVPLVRRRDCFTARGRIGADGSEIQPLNVKDTQRVARKIKAGGFDAVAIVFLNSYANPNHEKLAEQILRKSGFKGHVDISTEIDPQYREYERASTTVVNAALEPLVAQYLSRLEREVENIGITCPIYVLNSDGTSSNIEHAAKRPISIIESGPVAGVLGSKSLANSLGLGKVITFDMGGTTAKAGVIIDGEPDLSYEFEAAGKTHSGRSIKGSGYPVRQPFIDLAEVSSGGGTIARVDEAGALRAGPQSAGAEPGPVAYAKGGTEPTVTDANIVLGRINPDYLLGGALKLDPRLALDAITEKIAKRMETDAATAALGIIRIVQHSMARAISLVSVERGRDPRDFTMISFGGAGPIHSCELAEELGIKRVVVPQHPGLFSALGLLTADIARTFTVSIMRLATENLAPFFQELRTRAEESLKTEGFSDHRIQEFVDLRYQGQSYEITLPYDGETNLERAFKEQHKRLYGYSSNDPIEVVNARIKAVIPTPKARLAKREVKLTKAGGIQPSSSRQAWISETQAYTPVYTREKLWPGVEGTGPSIIEEYDSTTVVPNNWSWRIDEYGNIDMSRGR